ncbi:hypothetical protein QUB37_29180 [Microcoleus sp. AT3-A2]|uniref:hypothetical protein n=1 Tax=Microcoleus sp. AT3-A2 TaxID=2818610 RepID=UPI002FD35A30
MPHSADCPEGRSQLFTFARRDFLQKVASLTSLCLLPKSQPRSLYPSPEFKIGDLVAQDWESDDDEAPEFATDFGEILGMRWIPEPDGYCSVSNTWVYFVRWTHSNCPGILPEPYSDGELTLDSDLRLVNHV